MCLQWSFEVVGIAAGAIGTLALSTHNTAYNYMLLIISLPFGIGGAVTTLVGNCVGEGLVHSAKMMARTALLLEIFLASSYGLATFLLRDYIPKVSMR